MSKMDKLLRQTKAHQKQKWEKRMPLIDDSIVSHNLELINYQGSQGMVGLIVQIPEVPGMSPATNYDASFYFNPENGEMERFAQSRLIFNPPYIQSAHFKVNLSPNLTNGNYKIEGTRWHSSDYKNSITETAKANIGWAAHLFNRKQKAKR